MHICATVFAPQGHNHTYVTYKLIQLLPCYHAYPRLGEASPGHRHPHWRGRRSIGTRSRYRPSRRAAASQWHHDRRAHVGVAARRRLSHHDGVPRAEVARGAEDAAQWAAAAQGVDGISFAVHPWAPGVRSISDGRSGLDLTII